MKLPIPQNGVPTVSSLEISKITEKDHKNVLADIRRILEEAEIEGALFLAPLKMPSGQTASVYYLPRRECDLVVSGYSVKYRLAIIDRWHELEAKTPPMTRLERIRHEYMAALKEEALGIAHQALNESHHAIKPQHEYGSIAPDGRPRIGMRRAAFTVTRARVDEAIRLMEGQLFYQDQLTALIGQSLLPFEEE
jgi:phage regulator Rha-like protein